MIAELIDTEIDPPWQGFKVPSNSSNVTTQALSLQPEGRKISLLLPCAGLAIAILARMVWLAFSLL
jgi:hypothetical protein